MNGDKDAVLQKVKKLLALAGPTRGGTAAEAGTAMRLATELMQKHNIAMGGALAVEPEVKITDARVKTAGRVWKREKTLCAVFEYLCDVKAFWRSNPCMNYACYAGTPAGVAMATAMYSIFRSQLHQAKRRFMSSLDQKSCCEGCVNAIYFRAKVMAQQRHAAERSASTQAPVCVGKKQDALMKVWAAMGLRQAKTTKTHVSDACFEGQAGGRKADLGTRMRIGGWHVLDRFGGWSDSRRARGARGDHVLFWRVRASCTETWEVVLWGSWQAYRSGSWFSACWLARGTSRCFS